MFTKVENKNKKNAALEYYYHARDENGIDYLFSETQLELAIKRAHQNPEDSRFREVESPCTSWGWTVLSFVVGAAVGYVAHLLFVSSNVGL